MWVSEALLGQNEGCVSTLIGEQQRMITAVCVWLQETQQGANTTQMEDINTQNKLRLYSLHANNDH